MFLDLGAHTYTDVLSTWGGSQKIEEQISTNVLQRVMFAMGDRRKQQRELGSERRGRSCTELLWKGPGRSSVSRALKGRPSD